MSRRRAQPGIRADSRDPRGRPSPRADVYGSDTRASGQPDATRYGSDTRAAGPGADVRRVYLALLPLRIFLGVTLLYAGLDKLLDPTFLHATGPGSIGQQLAVFTHASPLRLLIEAVAQPYPVLTGVLIALVEIAIGLGALTGLLYRASAVCGFALSITFWLTASWTTSPYFYGPDLPYAFGWLTLALAGHGGLYTIESWLDRATAPGPSPYRRAPAEASSERRAFVQVMVIGAAAVALGGAAGILGRFLSPGRENVATSIGSGSSLVGPNPSSSSLGATAAGTPSPTTGAGPSASPTVAPAATPAASPAGQVLARLDQIQPRHAYGFQDPATGDPAVLVRLANNQVVAFDALCTHQGCQVGYDSSSGLLLCPCHGAVFDPTDGGRAVGGPTQTPLASISLKIDKATGTIILQG